MLASTPATMKTLARDDVDARPARRRAWQEPWVWFIAFFPLLAIVGGIVTFVIAWTHQDGLVADDYYKRGLAVNRALEREELAHKRGISAVAHFDAAAKRVVLDVTGTDIGNHLELRLVHPTRAGEDRVVPLAPMQNGRFVGSVDPGNTARWQVSIEPESRAWRLTGAWDTKSASAALR